MNRWRARICKACFAICFGLGCFCFLIVTFGGKAVKPIFLLDVVLTPEELKDRATCDRTLAILKEAVQPESGAWAFVGIAATLAGAVGYWSASGWVDPNEARAAGADGP